jgi:hypothetical protein
LIILPIFCYLLTFFTTLQCNFFKNITSCRNLSSLWGQNYRELIVGSHFALSKYSNYEDSKFLTNYMMVIKILAFHRRHDTQYNDFQHNDIKHNNKNNVTLSGTTLSIITEDCYAECLLCWVSFMLSVLHAECPLCWVSFMLRVLYAECPLCWVSFMLSVLYAECHLGSMSHMNHLCCTSICWVSICWLSRRPLIAPKNWNDFKVVWSQSARFSNKPSFTRF